MQRTTTKHTISINHMQVDNYFYDENSQSTKHIHKASDDGDFGMDRLQQSSLYVKAPGRRSMRS